MSYYARTTTFAFLSVLWCATSASAETMRCQSVNGNVNCAGSGAVSCQTIDGKKVCVGGNGDIVQSFGKGTSSTSVSRSPNDSGAADDDDLDDKSPGAGTHTHVEQRGPGGQTTVIDRNGTNLQVHSNRLSIDRN